MYTMLLYITHYGLFIYITANTFLFSRLQNMYYYSLDYRHIYKISSRLSPMSIVNIFLFFSNTNKQKIILGS